MSTKSSTDRKEAMKTIKSLWAKIPKQAQSALRHLSLTFAFTFAVTAKALLATELPAIVHAPDLRTRAALLLSLFLGAAVAAGRVALPLALVYAKALGLWLLKRLTLPAA
jgi:hypothetical protein